MGKREGTSAILSRIKINFKKHTHKKETQRWAYTGNLEESKYKRSYKDYS